jgi:hypothetical protein
MRVAKGTQLQSLSLSLSVSLARARACSFYHSLSHARTLLQILLPLFSLLPCPYDLTARPPTPTHTLSNKRVWARASGCDRGRRWFRTMWGSRDVGGSLHPPHMRPRAPAPPHPHQHHPRVKRDTPTVHQPTSLSPLHPGTAQPPTPTPTTTLLHSVRTRPSSACWPPSKNLMLVVTH